VANAASMRGGRANENLRRGDQAEQRACAAAERGEQAAIFASPARHARTIRGAQRPPLPDRLIKLAGRPGIRAVATIHRCTACS
jgi:hypothetical protein